MGKKRSTTPRDELRLASISAARMRWEMEMLLQLRVARMSDGMVREWTPFRDRAFRFDFAWPNAGPCPVALEVNGGIWSRGAHGSPTGILRDIEKQNLCTLRGIRLLRAAPEHIKSGVALDWLKEALGAIQEQATP